MGKKRVYVDMDGVICDYVKLRDSDRILYPDQPFPQSRTGFFIELEPIKDAIESYKKLEEHCDVWILTRPSVQNMHSYTEKVMWVRMHLGLEAQRKVIMSCDKSLLKGDILIDDDTQHGQPEFEGEHIHFGQKEFPDWKHVMNYLVTDHSNTMSI
jgi:5'(3')-deoxyribonucleotidase